MERNWKKHQNCFGREYDARWYDLEQTSLPVRWGIEQHGAIFKVVSSSPEVKTVFGPFDTFEAAAACFETLAGLD